MTKKLPLIFGLILLILVSVEIGYALGSQKYAGFISAMHLVRENDDSYFFVHPIIGFDVPDATQANQFAPLVSKIKKIFADNKSLVNRYSVYFRDLNKGFWVGINENDTYDPASMLKVALAFAVYKEAEENPTFLDFSTVYSQPIADINTAVPFADPTVLKVGESYTIDDLVGKMIVDSDNGAKDLLANTVDKSIQDDVYADLGMETPKDDGAYTLSTKKYSLFFRRLYSGSYLDKKYSNQLLELLSKTTFNDGLVAGVATSTVVSHKYGEHINSGDNTIKAAELHDCGVVYQPKSPYLLCVMTEGKSESDLAGIIATVSKAVNDEVVAGYK